MNFNMPDDAKIIYCHCAYAQVVPKAVKEQVLQQLAESGRAFEAVADLCEMSAKNDPMLKDLCAGGNLKIAACYPRAVRWLLASAGVNLPEAGAEVINMRVEPAEKVVFALLGEGFKAREAS
jgi:hypothetical protein